MLDICAALCMELGNAAVSAVSGFVWLLEGNADAPACEITFDRTGLPLKVRASNEHPTQPTVVWVHSSPIPQHLLTKGLIRNQASDYVLSEPGRQYINLVCGLER